MKGNSKLTRTVAAIQTGLKAAKKPPQFEKTNGAWHRVWLDDGPVLSPDEFNALPEKLRDYIYNLETRVDPAGDLKQLAIVTQQRDALVNLVQEQKAELNMSENNSHVTAITPADILQALYDSEINFSLATFWDAGFAWKLGDEMNGFKDEGECKTIDAAASMLALAAIKHFPESAFAKGAVYKKTIEKVHTKMQDNCEGTRSA